MTQDQKDLSRNVKKLLERMEGMEEPIPEKEACTYLGIGRQTMRDYVCSGKMDGTFIINILGKRMFYKSKLIIK